MSGNGFKSTLEELQLRPGHINLKGIYGTRIRHGNEQALFENLISQPGNSNNIGNMAHNGTPVMTTDLVAGMDLLEADLQSDDIESRKTTEGHFLSLLDNLKVWFKGRSYSNLSELEKEVRDRVIKRMSNKVGSQESLWSLNYTTAGVDLGETAELEQQYRNSIVN